MGLWRGFIVGVKGKRGRPRISQENQFSRQTQSLWRAWIENESQRSKQLCSSRLHRASVTPPMLLVREHMDLPHILWDEKYLTYRDQLLDLCVAEGRSEVKRCGGLDAGGRQALACLCCRY